MEVSNAKNLINPKVHMGSTSIGTPNLHQCVNPAGHMAQCISPDIVNLAIENTLGLYTAPYMNKNVC